MKLPLLFTAALAGGVAGAEVSDDLAKLRTGWKEARERALEPVDRKYLVALEALKTRLTKAGDLDGALEVEKEIGNLPSTGVVSSPVSGTVWQWHKGQFLFVRENGRAELYGAFPQVAVGSWKLTSPRRITVVTTSPEPSREFKIVLGDDLHSAQVTSATGAWAILRQ